jgi:hypothetical protein
MESLGDLVVRAQSGDLEAYAALVRKTHAMAYAVARGVPRDGAAAEDAIQDAYLRAFRRLRLDEAESTWSELQRLRLAGALLTLSLERLAMLRYGIDDIRKIEAARVA